MDWYAAHQRQLPWRATGDKEADPYGVWVSEIMLQQTQVDVVRPRFVDFMTAFPNVASLATASSERVKEQWSGLGYYRRAEALHAAAKVIVEQGEFPRTTERLRRLPGIGEYTAAAIASIAYGEPVAVLDGNVERVLSRLHVIEGNPKHRGPRRRLQAAADALLDRERPGVSNQAMMELGALVCGKQNPRCTVCPLDRDCAAHAAGLEGAFPETAPKGPRRKLDWYFAIEIREPKHADVGMKLLLERRPNNEPVLAGCWLPPTLAQEEPSEQAIEAQASDTPKPGTPELGTTELGRFKHAITKTDYTVVLVRRTSDLRAERASPIALEPSPSADQCWVSLDDFDQDGRWRGSQPLPTSSILHKTVVAVRATLLPTA